VVPVAADVVVVTGATGFIGRRLIDRLASISTVYAASRSGADVGASIGVRFDLEDFSTFANLPPHADVVVHLAALIDSDDLQMSLRVNVAGTAELLDYTRRAAARIFIYGSTGGVYGAGSGCFHETDRLNPQDSYGLSKAQAEGVVEWFAGDFTKVVLRYCAPYGLGTPNPMTRIVSSVLAGRPIAVASSMSPRFNPLHLDDAVELTLRAMEYARDAVFNISGTEVTTFAGVALTAGQHAGIAPILRCVPAEELLPYHRADTTLAGEYAWQSLDYVPVISLTEGIAGMVDDMRSVQGI